jgi:hypothetical protein
MHLHLRFFLLKMHLHLRLAANLSLTAIEAVLAFSPWIVQQQRCYENQNNDIQNTDTGI